MTIIQTFVRMMFLLGAIDLGGYAFGTPGSQPWSAFFSGVFIALYVQSGRWFADA